MSLRSIRLLVNEIYDSFTRLHKFPEATKKILIGRGDVQIRVSDPEVSRTHALISQVQPGVFTVMDLDTANGTYVNGRHITEEATLKSGDTLRVGNTEIIFSIAAQQNEVLHGWPGQYHCTPLKPG